MKVQNLFRNVLALTVLLALLASFPLSRSAATAPKGNDAEEVISGTVARLDEPRVVVRDIGPELGVSYAIEGFLINLEDRRQILVTSQNGLFKSFDGGSSWRRVNLLNDDGISDFVSSLRQDPGNPSVVYAATDDGIFGTFYRSSDFGDTWVPLTGFSSLADFAVHQTSPDVIFLLQRMADDIAFIKTIDGVDFEYQFDNGLPEGLFDDSSGKQLADPVFTSMATTPSDPNVVYVVNIRDTLMYYPGGVYKSTDGGNNFVRLDRSPAEPLQVFPHPTQPNTIFVQAQGGSWVTGIYRSTDGGATFAEIIDWLPAGKFNFFVAFDRRNPSFVYVAGEGGLFRSTDGGSTFTALGLRQSQIGGGATTLRIDPANSDVIYVNTSQGNFKSVNGGISFFAINKGWQAASANQLTFDNHGEPSLYIVTSGGNGILRTQSRGSHYEQVAGPVIPSLSINFSRVSALAVAPTDRDFLVALTSGKGIYRSTDGGRTWSAASIDTGQTRFTSTFNVRVVIDPTNPNNIYVASANNPFPGFYRSTDGGQTFYRTYHDPSSLPRSALLALALDPTNPQVIYTGSVQTGGLRKSTDGGLSFTMTPLGGFRERVFDIAVDPPNPQNVYVAGQFQEDRFSPRHTVLRSTDGGATFAPSDNGLSGFLFTMKMDPVTPSRLFSWTTDGLFMTNDGAANWTLVEGEETKQRAGFGFSLAINPKHPNLIYLGGASILEIEIK